MHVFINYYVIKRILYIYVFYSENWGGGRLMNLVYGSLFSFYMDFLDECCKLR